VASPNSNPLPSIPLNSSPLESKFAEAQSRLGTKRQKLLRSIIENSEETCFLSSRELAKRFDVDAATVVRSVQALGYTGFADFTRDLRQHFISRTSPYVALKAATREKRSIKDHIDHSIDKALDNLNLLRSQLDRNQVIQWAKQIHRSRKIMIVGVDLAASLAYHLAYGLSSLGIDAEAPVGSEGSLQHKVKVLTKKDLLVAISFGQCLRVTVEALLRANKLGVKTFGITDSDSTPIARYSANYLLASTASPSFINSYAAPSVIINTILVACAHVNPKRSLNQLRATNKEYLSGPRWYYEPKRLNSDSDNNR
jgi:DNA-binding MurR/RpiR family transcriptional regulator